LESGRPLKRRKAILIDEMKLREFPGAFIFGESLRLIRSIFPNAYFTTLLFQNTLLPFCLPFFSVHRSGPGLRPFWQFNCFFSCKNKWKGKQIMKNRIIIIGMALLLVAGFSACDKEESAPVYYPASNNQMAGKWAVASFEINGVEHSDFYTPYLFYFKDGGIILAKGAGREITGTWSMKPVNNEASLQLDFGSIDPFNLLNSGNWKIVSSSSSKMEMTSRRGDDGTQSLTLEKR
jgi:hypothetical protein